MKLKLVLVNGNNYNIELIDHPFVHEWAKSVVKLKLRRTERVYLAGNKIYSNTDKEVRDIIKVLKKLKKNGVVIPKIFFNIVDNTDNVKLQQTNNIMHRWCVLTQLHREYTYGQFNNASAIKFLKNNPENKIFNKLNALIHRLETCYPRPGREMFDNDLPYWDQDFITENYFKNPINYKEISELVTNDNYNVWIAKRIPGKDWRECYIDQDDPTQPDIVNFYDHIRYAFEIDLNDRSKFYYSKEFNNWLEKYKLTYSKETMGRIALGNIDPNIKHELQNGRIKELSIA